MRVDELLDLLRVNILTSADDHVLQTSRDTVIALRCAAGQIARVQPSVLIDRRSRRFRHLVVTLHNVVAAGHELADDLIRAVLPGLRIDDLAFHLGKCGSDGRDTDFQRIRRPAHGTAGRRLRLTVDNDDLRHMHFLDDVSHDRDRARAAGHDTGPHVAEIRLREIFMREHRDEHRRNSVECRDMLIIDAGKRRLR